MLKKSSTFIVVGTVLIACASVFLLAPSKEAPATQNISVYMTEDDCVDDGGTPDYCHRLKENAELGASLLNWPFNSEKDCAEAYGADQCIQDDNDSWRVKMAGFTQFSYKEDDIQSAMPVFKSSIHPGLYLPNAYPMVSGKNTVPLELTKKILTASRARSLQEEVCVEISGAEVCSPIYRFVRGVVLSKTVVKSIFQ